MFNLPLSTFLTLAYTIHTRWKMDIYFWSSARARIVSSIGVWVFAECI